MKAIVRATMVLGLIALIFVANVSAGDCAATDEKIPVQVGDVNRDGAVTPSDGYMILESCGKPQVKAEMKDGVLRITLPKNPKKDKEAKEIEIH